MRNRKELTPEFVRSILEYLASMRGSVKQIVRTHRKIGRNELCRCGSGIKYKFCCWSGDVRYGVR